MLGTMRLPFLEMEFCDASLQGAFDSAVVQTLQIALATKIPSISKEVEDLKYNSHENLVFLILKRSKRACDLLTLKKTCCHLVFCKNPSCHWP